MPSFHDVRFPGETPAYREARNALLAEELELRRRLETVAALRRKLPLGGLILKDYAFEDVGLAHPEAAGKSVRLSDLFRPGKDTLVVYSFMCGPEMKEACPSCTSILDALDGQVQHLEQRVNFAVVAKSPIARLKAHAQERGWRRLPLLSSAANTYNHDYQGENAEAEQTPTLNVFARRPDGIHHFYNTELLFCPPEPGQDGRHVDLLWPLWNVLDTTPEGRGTDWQPKLRYQ